MINTNLITSSSYNITGTGSYLGTTNGTYYINSVTVSYDKGRYDKTDHIVSHRGLNLPVYLSKNGKPFIFAIGKNGCEYKKYIK